MAGLAPACASEPEVLYSGRISEALFKVGWAPLSLLIRGCVSSREVAGKMKSDFLIALTQLAAERHLPREQVLGAIEVALASAFKKDNPAILNPPQLSEPILVKSFNSKDPILNTRSMDIKNDKIINTELNTHDHLTISKKLAGNSQEQFTNSRDYTVTYKIYRDETLYAEGVEGINFTDTDLDFLESHTYTIRQVNEVAQSNHSNEAGASTNDCAEDPPSEDNAYLDNCDICVLGLTGKSASIIRGDFLDDSTYTTNNIRFEEFPTIFNYINNERDIAHKIFVQSPSGTKFVVLGAFPVDGYQRLNLQANLEIVTTGRNYDQITIVNREPHENSQLEPFGFHIQVYEKP